jgi:branched-chain amino acid transport system substrate-binding protein
MSSLADVADDEVHVGVGAPLSGVAAHLGREMAQAATLAVDDANAAGGVLGRPIVAHVADDCGDPAVGTDIARSFGSDPRVVGVVGHYNSDVALAVEDVYHDAGLAMVNPIVSNPGLTERGLATVFRLTNRDDRTGEAIAGHLVRALGKRRAAVIATTTTYGLSMADQFARAFVAAGGDVVAWQSVTEGAGDAEVADLVRSLPRDVDMVFYGGSFEGAAAVRAMRSAGLGQLLATGDGCWDVDAFLTPAGAAASEGDGTLVLSATPQIGEVPGSAAFASRYRERYGPIGNYAVNSYDAMGVLLGAIGEAAASTGAAPSRSSVVSAVRDRAHDGIAYASPTRWDAKGDNLATGTYLNVVDDGRFRQVAEIPRPFAG